jgi:hypothetical protein
VKDIWVNAKKNQEILHFKNFQEPEITWGDVLKFVYDLSKVQASDAMTERKDRSPGFTFPFGNVLLRNGYFLFEENNLFSTFKGVTELMQKVNGGNSGSDCSYYNKSICNCQEQWHIQTLRFSISDYTVSDHNDPNNVLYWQLLGTSYWIMNKDKEYKLEPGDLLYFNQEDSHLVWQDGPRAGIIIDDIKDRDKHANKIN